MKKYSRYIIGTLLLLPVCLLMYLFAYTAEHIRILFCVLEYLGLYNGYKYSTRNTIIWVVAVVLIFVLLKVAFKLIKSEKELLKKYRILKALPYIIICLNLANCFFFPKIDQLFLRFRHGLDGVIMPDRGTASLLRFAGFDVNGNTSDPLLGLSLESFGSEEEIFYVKFVSIEDETKQYVFYNKNETPQIIRMGELLNSWSIEKGNYKARYTSFGVDVEKIIPGYIDTPENRRLLKYKAVIFNDNESKTFYFYFD